MKRLLFAFAVFTALSIAAGSAMAQGPPPGYAAGPPPGYAGPPPGYSPGGPPAGYGEQMYGGNAYGGYMGGSMGSGGHKGGGFVKFGLGGTGLLSGIFTNHPKNEKEKGQGGRGWFGGDRQERIRNAQTLPTAQGGGTLVYPQNPFVRSPRDFFMWDEK